MTAEGFDDDCQYSLDKIGVENRLYDNGWCYEFDGATSKIDVYDQATLTTMTFGCFIRTTATTGNITGGTNIFDGVKLVAGNFVVNNGVSDVDSGIAVNDGDWHHVAFTYNPTGNVLRLYVDGQFVLENTAGNFTNGQITKIGTNAAEGAFLATEISLAQMASSIRTDQQVLSMSQKACVLTDCDLIFRMDETAGTTALDVSQSPKHSETTGITHVETYIPLYSWHNTLGYNIKADYDANGWPWQAVVGGLTKALDNDLRVPIVFFSVVVGDCAIPTTIPFIVC